MGSDEVEASLSEHRNASLLNKASLLTPSTTQEAPAPPCHLFLNTSPTGSG